MPKSPEADSRRLQMADIARLAGVSTSTVSRALAGSKLISEETRSRVMELARSLNYSINIGAQNLRMKQNRTVGVVVPYDPATRQHLSDPFFLSMLGSLADALTEQGFDMLVSRVDAGTLDAAATPFDTGRVIGIVLIGQWRHHDQLNQLAARHVPIVVWGAQLPQQLYCTVGGDNLAGGELAGAHLLAQGRKRIAFFGDINLPEIGQRYQGLCQALTAAGIAADPALLVPASFVPNGGRLAVDELLARKAPFDAVFAGSDLMAMDAINALRQHGLDVPGQVAVLGYDDIPLASYFHPPLTTVRQPMQEAGRALVAALLELAEGGVAPSVQLPTQLIIRSSTV
ncbi:LacI family DNA-binding transcriptional regulator [Duganella sp. FT80W]|uniref:LacI family DNA-binding transcriptional regulator n=1 Tax=Duganella guangzhouensis TaxID=2666084 RepID=A0A6I2L6M1_9BURK|nr:LacI family DNA-binding transcriptional regulator [Duganella guangzhouensis]MRW93410.1 LacI family DNA-binding transcriptional regulator [Duganella guangzhouensis]